jgi:hypothetical protein
MTLKFIATSFPTLLLAIGLAGCNSAPKPAPAPKEPAKPTVSYPARPTVPAPSFTLFHFDNDTATLVVKEDATDDEIESLVWQVRDAARSNTLPALKLKAPKGNDFRAHIYRGKKCAAEKYAPGEPPCGGSYHGAGDYTLSKLPSRLWDRGVLHASGDKEIELWDTDAPYTATK